MRRVIGMDIHRTFGEVVFWEDGQLGHAGRVDMTRTGLGGFGKSLVTTDEVVIEATGNCMAVSRVLSPFVKRVIIANPLQIKAIAHAHVKTDKIDAGTLASLYAAGYLPEIWTPNAATERLRRLVARRYQIVRHRTRIKNEVHGILNAHLIPNCRNIDPFTVIPAKALSGKGGGEVFMGFAIPLGAGFDHGVQDDDKASGDGDNGDLVGFALLSESLVDSFCTVVVT